MTDPCVLAIDLGTSGPKVALVSSNGRTIAWTSRPVGTRLLDHGGAEQDPREMWAAIVLAPKTGTIHRPAVMTSACSRATPAPEASRASPK